MFFLFFQLKPESAQKGISHRSLLHFVTSHVMQILSAFETYVLNAESIFFFFQTTKSCENYCVRHVNYYVNKLGFFMVIYLFDTHKIPMCYSFPNNAFGMQYKKSQIVIALNFRASKGCDTTEKTINVQNKFIYSC